MDTAIRNANWLHDAEDTAPAPRVTTDWPLMGDIVSHRMNIPDHLIRWRAQDARRKDESRGAHRGGEGQL